MDFDVIIIGSGQAGGPLATRLAKAGRSVLLVERQHVGGTCVNVGCTPTKTMIASARAAHVARGAARLGVETGSVRVDLAAVVDRKDAIVQQWREGVLSGIERVGKKLELLRGHARFVGAHEIAVEETRHAAPTIIVNTGARPNVPALPGLQDVPWLHNGTVMSLRETPRHLLVLGGGYIAVEFGQMFRRFGSEVTIVERGDQLLGREDDDVTEALQDVFRAEGMTLELGASAQSVARQGSDIVLQIEDGRTLRGSHLLVATGRRPNTDDLDCPAAGIELDGRGAIRVDDHYKTSAAGIYAVGDVTGGPQFTHTAWDDHRLLFDFLMGRGTRGRNNRHIPFTVFTDPPLARVGMTEKEAKKAGLEYEMATMPFGHIARAIEIDEPAGLLKILIDPKTEKILGACILGSEAGELIHVFVVLMQAGVSPRALVEAQAVHPTFAEGLQSLAMKLGRYSLS